MNTINVYPAVNYKSFSKMVIIITLSLASIFCFWFIINVPFSWFTIIMGLNSLWAPLILIYGYTAKVIITEDEIIKRSIFGSKSILIKNIKSIGVYLQVGNGSFLLSKEDVAKQEQNNQKNIHISDKINYNPNSFSLKGILKFNYREDLYENIKEIISTNEGVKYFNK